MRDAVRSLLKTKQAAALRPQGLTEATKSVIESSGALKTRLQKLLASRVAAASEPNLQPADELLKLPLALRAWAAPNSEAESGLQQSAHHPTSTPARQ